MSTYRHFQDRGTGQVHSVALSALTRYFTDRPDDYREIQAVATDAVVIEGPLPEVTPREDGTAHYTSASFNGTTYGPPVYATGTENPDAVHAQGLARIALARHLREHLRANPPVDQEQVKALESLVILAVLREKLAGAEAPREIAERMYRAGARVEVAS